MLCVGDARIGPVPQRWWAIARAGRHAARAHSRRGGSSSRPGGCASRPTAWRSSSTWRRASGSRSVTPDGSGVHLDAQAGATSPARGTRAVGGRESSGRREAFVDDRAGYHARHTAWKWSPGVGRSADGRALGWNLVTGIHDSPTQRAHDLGRRRAGEVGPVAFADDLSARFGDGCASVHRVGAREDRTNLLLLRSDYRQPFGTFEGELPAGLELAEGYGVMEEHEVWW